MRTSVLTLLMTSLCPLDCRYCTLSDKLKTSTSEMSFEEMIERIGNFKASVPETNTKMIVFTGGEPFARWQDIKKVIQLYPDFRFEFNTSGYLLSEDIIKFLTKFKVSWNLSVDGGEKLTNYLRPTRGRNGSYFKKLRAIAPVLLYYYPDVCAKIIIGRRTIDLFYETFLEIEQLGFKRLNLITDITERATLDKEGLWTNEDYFKLTEQFQKVAEEYYLSIGLGIDRMRIANFDEILASLLNYSKPSSEDLACGLFDGRLIHSVLTFKKLEKGQKCFDRLGYSNKEFQEILENSLKEHNYKCPNDTECLLFSHCSKRTCPKDNMEFLNDPYKCEPSFCNLMKAIGSAVFTFLALSNEAYKDNLFYYKFLQQYIERGQNYGS